MAASIEQRVTDLEQAVKNAHVKIARLEQLALKGGVSAKAIAAATKEVEAAPAPKASQASSETGNVGYYYSADLNKALYIDKNGKFWRIQADGKRGEKPIKAVELETYALVGLIAGPALLAKKLREGGEAAPAATKATTKTVAKVIAKPKAQAAAQDDGDRYDGMDAAALRELIETRKGDLEKIVAGTWARGRAIAMRNWLRKYDMRKAAKAVTAAPAAKAKSGRQPRAMG